MTKTNTKNSLIKIITIGLPVLMVVGAAELVLRFTGPAYYKINNTSSVYYSNPRGYHIPLRKDGKHIIYGLLYKVSPEGYRLPDDPFPHDYTTSTGVPGILAIGDSFSAGQGVKYEDLYTTQLFRMLKRDGYRPYIKNCGKCGANINEIVKIHTDETTEAKYPIVVYGFVLNDFGLAPPIKISGNDFIDKNNGVVRWKAYHYLNAIRNISKTFNLVMFCIEKYRLNTTTTKAYLNAFKDKNAQKKFDQIADINQRTQLTGGKLVMMIFPLLYDFQNYPFREIHEKITSFCAKENIPMLDLLPYYSKYNARDLWANPTDQHPNEIAHKITAEKLYDFLVKQKLVTKASLP